VIEQRPAGPCIRAGADPSTLRPTLIALARQVHAGRAAGMPIARIVAVTRLDPELVTEILAKAPGELPDVPR